MLPFSPNIPVVLAALLALSGLALQQWSLRRGRLLRLRAAMGEDPDAGPPRSSLVSLLAWLGTHIPGASDNGLRMALTGAGYFQPSALPVFVASRLIASGAMLILVLGHGGVRSPANLFLAVFLTFLTSRLFVILLKLKAEARQRGIRRELPPLIDILLMVLNSGVSIDQCLHYVATLLEQTAPLTGQVFRRYVADVDSGVPYEAAFERLGQRLAIDEGYDLANLIKQALLQGGEILAPLERFGSEIADRRVALAREQIGRKSVLLTLVMLAFFMPVLMIALGGPAVSNISDTLKNVNQELRHRSMAR
jgi:tight adherence protein C